MTTARFLALVTTLLVVVTMQATAGADMEATAVEEPMDISWFGPFGGEIEDGNPVQAHIEEKFNVKLVNTQLWRRDREKYQLLFASGEEPDAGYMYVTPRDYYLQGVFRSIPKEMIVEHVPSMAAWLDSMGPAAWMYGLVPGKEDEYMGLVRSYDYAGGVSYFPVFRLDWLEKIDMAPAELIPRRCRHLGRQDLLDQDPLHLRRVREDPVRLPQRRPGRQRNGRHDSLCHGQHHRLPRAAYAADDVRPERRGQLR